MLSQSGSGVDISPIIKASELSLLETSPKLKYGFTEALYSIEDMLERRLTLDSLGECKTRLIAFIPVYTTIVNLIISSLEKEGIYLPFRSVLIICVKIPSSPTVFLSWCNFLKSA